MGDGGSMLFGVGFMWIFWVLLIVLIVWSIRGIGNNWNGNKRNNTNGDTPLKILKKRYARGEIDEQEYERRKKELEN